MKVGLLTYHFSDNYGALIQAYALQQWFNGRGVTAEFINYHPAYVEEGGSFDRPWKLSLWRKNVTIAYMWQAHIRRRFFGDKVQRKRFESFRRDVLGVTGERIRKAEKLLPVLADKGMLICGSDQIWNPSVQRGLDPVYFLNIVGAEHCRKVAYAPSFGRNEIEPSHNEELRLMASELHGLSVREYSGLNILERAGVSRQRAIVVPDPTILLGCFHSLLGDDIASDNSVFCYALRTDEVIRDVAIATARITSSSLLAPRTTHQRWADIGDGIVLGPIEWLKTLAKARVVVSNSFHGVALSIVLNRPFIAVGLPGKRAKMNARVENLLMLTGLEHRLLTDSDPVKVQELAETPIDWEAVNLRLASIRSDAEVYLDEHLAKAQEQSV